MTGQIANTFKPVYSRWRHGGWYVHNVRYPSGACGCVSRNYPDGKWRIVCDERDPRPTYPSRDAAALAELELIQNKSPPQHTKLPWVYDPQMGDIYLDDKSAVFPVIAHVATDNTSSEQANVDGAFIVRA